MAPMPLLGVMENDAECVALARSQTTNAVPEICAVESALAANRSVVDSERHGVSFRESNDLCARLHARTLLHKSEFPTGKVPSRLRQENGDLDRKYVFAIQILVKAVEIARPVLKQKGRRPELSGLMATVKVVGMIFWISHIDSHDLVPSVGNCGEMRIKSGPQFGDDIGQRVAEVFVLTSANAVTLHDYATAEMLIVRVKRGESIAFFRRQDPWKLSIAVLIEFLRNALPVKSAYAFCGILS